MPSLGKSAAFAAVVLASFLAGTWYQARVSPAASGQHRRILYYTCPMHPQYRSATPGDAPCCGMRLEPVYADTPLASAAAREATLPGTVEITPERQQLIGLRVAPASLSTGDYVLRTLGRAAPDERRLYRLNAAADGWIRETYSNTTGSLVKKGEPLASFYSPEFLGAEQAYLFALGALDRFQATGKETPEQIKLTYANVQQYLDSLRNLGMDDIQIEELKRTRELTQEIRVYAPASAFVLARNVSPGQRFEKGYELYRLADLSRIWVLADLFENEAQLIRPGQSVTVKYRGRSWRGQMGDVLPRFDPDSRTLKVRFEVDNPGYGLRPDMFVDIEYPVTLPPAVTVPVDAVVDSGLRKTVYVDLGNGYFEPRAIETGWKFGERVEVTSGLKEGERIVVAGTFMLDSESRMKLVAAQAQKPEQKKPPAAVHKDPVCGMDVEPDQSTPKCEYRGRTHYFCSDHCKREFDKNPAKFVDKKA